MNRKYLTRNTLLGLLACLVGTSAQAQTLQTLHVGAFVGVASAQEPKPADKPAADAKDEPVVVRVTSATVRDAQGLVFGKMENIVIDPSSGKIEFAMVVNAVNTNVLTKVTPIPWRLLTARNERRGPF